MITFTTTGNVLKEMMKPLSMIDEKARITFTDTVMKSMIVNSSNVTMMNYELPVMVFDSYSIDVPTMTIGIDFTQWYSIVNQLDNNEICTITIVSEPMGLPDGNARLENHKINIESMTGFFWNTPLISPESMRKEPKIPEEILKHLVSDFEISVKRFNMILKRSFSEYITFETMDSMFKTYSEHLNKSNSITHINRVGQIVKPAKTELNINYLLKLNKILKSNTIRIHLGKDYPIQIDFSVFNHGSASYLQAPRIKSQ